MKSLDDLPLYLRASDVMKILPVGKTKVHEIMNDPSTGVIRVGPKIKLWPRDKFIAWLESLDNQIA